MSAGRDAPREETRLFLRRLFLIVFVCSSLSAAAAAAAKLRHLSTWPPRNGLSGAGGRVAPAGGEPRQAQAPHCCAQHKHKHLLNKLTWHTLAPRVSSARVASDVCGLADAADRRVAKSAADQSPATAEAAQTCKGAAARKSAKLARAPLIGAELSAALLCRATLCSRRRRRRQLSL